ncbi:hypothetical protein JCM10212_000365, partial [Sporobolomyces blumeae]
VTSPSSWSRWRKRMKNGESESLKTLPFRPLTPLLPLSSFRKQFASYLADDISSEDIEDMYREAHEKIREDPVYHKTEKADLAKWKEASKKTHPKKLSLQQRRERVEAKKAAYYAAKN